MPGSVNSKINKTERKMCDTSGDDFATPTVFKKFKQSNINPSPFSNKNKIRSNSRKKQLTLHQMVKENLQYSDVNPEHLQMALALSRSISENQNDNIDTENFRAFDVVKHEKKRTLLEFGFKTNKNKINTENRISKKETLRINKKSKFRFITPTLCLRSEEDRESLVQSKLSLIITQNIQENSLGPEAIASSEIMSEELLKIHCSECRIFHLNHNFNEFSRQNFNVLDLNILEDRAKCGYLLKDWKNIALREHSPECPVMFRDWKKKLNGLQGNAKFYSKENKDCEDKTHESAIDKSNPQKLASVASNVHGKTEKQDEIILNTKFEHMPNIHLTLSPDLFEDQQAVLSNHMPIAETYSEKVKKKLENLFSAPLDDTITLSNNSYNHDHLESPVYTNSSMDGDEYPYCVRSQVSENIVIISSSDEENIINSVTTNVPENAYASKKQDSCFLNSIQADLKKNSHSLNIPAKSALKCNNVSIHNSDKNRESCEKNKHISCFLQGSNDISCTMDELDSRNESLNSIFSSAPEEDLPMTQFKSIRNFESVMEDTINGHENQCTSNVVESDCHISKYLSDGNKQMDNKSPADELVDNMNHNSFSDDCFINKIKFDENVFTHSSVEYRSFQITDDEKIDKISFCNSFSESSKNISMNVTEHIEEMLALNHSPVMSSNLSYEESKRSYNNTESFESKKVSTSSLSENLQNFRCKKFQISKKASENILLKTNQKKYINEKYSSASTYDICISDEEIGYSSNVIRSENNLNKKNCVSEYENVAVLNKEQDIVHSYGTPLKRFASFTESSNPKEAAFFGKNKSESDITTTGKFIIKTENISPIVNYAQLDTPDIIKELGKYGVKPLKRKRGVKLLKHIYEATHPIVESKGQIVDGNNKCLKKAKKDKYEIVSQKVESIIPDNLFHEFQSMEPWTATASESDLIFERRFPKIPFCQIPLQIVWHNFLLQNPEIRKNILLYEPLQVDIVYKMLKDEGYKFHLQDLQTFLDRKCITIKVSQNHKNIKN